MSVSMDATSKTPFDDSNTSISPRESQQTRNRADKIRVGVCSNDGTAGIGAACTTRPRLLRLATADGLCFTCYRRKREMQNPNLLIKRRSGRASYARRSALDQKLQRQLGFLRRIQDGALAELEATLTPSQYAALSRGLTKVLKEIATEYNQERDRRLKFINRMERIEAEGDVPVVVGSRSVISTRALQEYFGPEQYAEIEPELLELHEQSQEADPEPEEG